MKTKFQKIISISIVLGLIFGFDDKQTTFSLGIWFLNYIRTVIASIIVVTIFALAEEWVAKKTCNEASIHFWKVKRYWFGKGSKVKGRFSQMEHLPIGALIGLISTLFSNGAVKIAALIETEVKTTTAKRFGRKFTQGTLWEIALICATGPLAVIFLALITKAVLPANAFSMDIITIGRYLALFSLIPIPKLNGCAIYFGSPLLFSSTVVFVLILFIILPFLSALASIAIAVILAVVFLITHMQYGFVNAK